MENRSRFIIVFSVILIIWVTSYIVHIYETKSSFKISSIDVNTVQSIKIKDGGIKGSRTIIISNTDTIREIIRLIKKSTLVNWDDINIKANQGEYNIFLISGNKVITSLRLINTSFSGAILESGDYNYRNDSLMSHIFKILK